MQLAHSRRERETPSCRARPRHHALPTCHAHPAALPPLAWVWRASRARATSPALTTARLALVTRPCCSHPPSTTRLRSSRHVPRQLLVVSHARMNFKIAQQHIEESQARHPHCQQRQPNSDALLLLPAILRSAGTRSRITLPNTRVPAEAPKRVHCHACDGSICDAGPGHDRRCGGEPAPPLPSCLVFLAGGLQTDAPRCHACDAMHARASLQVHCHGLLAVADAMAAADATAAGAGGDLCPHCGRHCREAGGAQDDAGAMGVATCSGVGREGCGRCGKQRRLLGLQVLVKGTLRPLLRSRSPMPLAHRMPRRARRRPLLPALRSCPPAPRPHWR